VTVDDIPQTQFDHFTTDFQAFLDQRSRRPGQRKRRGIALFGLPGTLPPDDHILDIAHAYDDANPVAEAFVKDAYIDGNPSHGRAMGAGPGTRSRHRPSLTLMGCGCRSGRGKPLSIAGEAHGTSGFDSP
jgi:hypothetical protein